ncbi:N-acetylmuramoyl-L-alanine amidase [Sodalis sp. dw_96]|uniref:N-acetylmuramoyl-L-alanine amidase n=1 Tax=Sodalis sp. dw_96 TaxID=2719794 RepID=UPI001BD2D5D1|nr:N-acetylmuramoyl-L-alanine amidase [Sodalis sp. dw_96]
MHRVLLYLCLVLVAGCTGNSGQIDRGDYLADTTVSSRSQDERIRFLVMHYTAADDNESLRLLTQGQVSAHYLVHTSPEIIRGKPVASQLVAEEKRAWHGGESHWQGRDNLNDTSLGIEIVNPGFSQGVKGKHWYPFKEDQIELVARLARDIIHRYGISPANVLAHSDIAPLRKSDPGPLFPWQLLAQRGIGAWPDRASVDKYLAGRAFGTPASVANIQRTLARYGYRIPQNGLADEETLRTISAFQMHFRPTDFSGTPDAQTEAIAMALVEKYRS